MNLTKRRRVLGSVSSPIIYSYLVRGKEGNRSYQGRVTICVAREEPRVTAARSIDDGVYVTGHGTLRGETLTLRFARRVAPGTVEGPDKKVRQMTMAPRFEPPQTALRCSVSGRFVLGRKTL